MGWPVDVQPRWALRSLRKLHSFHVRFGSKPFQFPSAAYASAHAYLEIRSQPKLAWSDHPHHRPWRPHYYRGPGGTPGLGSESPIWLPEASFYTFQRGRATVMTWPFPLSFPLVPLRPLEF